MIELHLIGYTADLTHLVLDVDPDARRGGHRLVIDADLFLTLDEIRDLRRSAGLDVGDLPGDTSDTAAEDAQPSIPERGVAEISGDEEPVVFEAPTSTTESTGPLVDAPDDDEKPPGTHGEAVAPGEPAGELVRILHGGDDLDAARPDQPTDDESREQQDRDDAPPGGTAGRDDSSAEETPADQVTDEPETVDDVAEDTSPADRPASLLSPAEIQTLLRGGRSPRSVAKRAETDVSWVERWLPPIIAERNQILDRARQARLKRPRLGASSQPLGRAVEMNLRGRGVDLADVDWSAKRRADGTWSVSVRYTSRGRSRTASWRFDREAGSISASSRLATELGFTKRRTRRSKT